MKDSVFNIIDGILTVLGHGLAAILLGVAYTPSFLLVYWIFHITASFSLLPKAILIMVSTGFSFFIGGYILLLVIVAFRKLFIAKASRVKFYRNSFPIFGFGAYHGMLALAEFTIMPLIRGTFIMRLFYIGMGAKIGRNTRVNTNRMSDCDLIEIGENCVIGGDVLINGHSGEGQDFIRDYVRIGNNVTIGSFTMILPGAVIEDNVIVGANSVVTKNQRLVANNIYVGSPARILRPNISRPEPQLKQLIVETPNSDIIQLENLKKDIDHTEVMLSSYQKLSTEISTVENHIANITVTALGSVVTIGMYSVLSEISFLASLPPLVFLAAGLILSTTSAMLKVAFKMAQIEILFQGAGATHFNWETEWGIFGKSRLKDLDGVLISSLFAAILVASLWLTFSGLILDLHKIIMGFYIWKVLVAIYAPLALWLLFSGIFLVHKTNMYNRELQKLKDSLEPNGK